MLQHTTNRLMLLSLLFLSVAFTACNSGSTQSAGAVLPSSADSATVKVTAKDFSYELDQPAASAGMITFTIQNAGTTPHDFTIEGNGVEQKIPVLDPGQSATLNITLPPGTYSYKCTVPGHDILGMKGSLTVNSGTD